MLNIKNQSVSVKIDESNGLICGLYWQSDKYNLVDKKGMGGITYTLKGDDISTNKDNCMYVDKLASFDSVSVDGDNVKLKNTEFDIEAAYILKSDGIIIKAQSSNESFSQFGIDCNMNFLSKKNGTYLGQLIPSSPYTSYFGDKLYCIMPMIEYGFCIISAKSPCKAWKIDYSDYSYGHYINDFKMLSSLDDAFEKGGSFNITIELTFAKTVEECYEKIHELFECPMLIPKISGTFGKYIDIDILGNADYVKVIKDGTEKQVTLTENTVRIESEGYGRYTVIPYKDGKAGLDTTVWFGEDINTLYEKSCDTVTEIFYDDIQLCENMCWCWAKLIFMNFYNSKKYIAQVTEALEAVMCETGELITYFTIVPYALNGYPAYHLHNSKRVQNQFFGVSMLTEMYKLTNDCKYLDFAIKSAETMIESYQQENGAIVPHKDYTTVCAPIIALVDLSVLLRDIDGEKSAYFAKASKKIADYLVERDLHFPTEGVESEVNDEEMEEGSISCTALSVLYYCKYIECRQEYIDFAEKVLKFHDWWRIYSPDVRLYMGTMRWWETIWEGDAKGPCICAGHPWGIWRAEADFLMAELSGNPDYFVKSWNGYINNFSKITPDGYSYSCYQPDYIMGGGHSEVRGENFKKEYEITHDYPKKYDSSISRYAWARAGHTWLQTAVVIMGENDIKNLNCDIDKKEVKVSEHIKTLYVFGNDDGYIMPDKNINIVKINN